MAPCFGIDLPGCGRSGFSPKTWAAYSHPALVELLSKVIEDACKLAQVKEVILISHSMGCSLAASLVSETSDLRSSIRSRLIGMITICPKASLPSTEQIRKFEQLLRIPTPVFNVLRRWDRRGDIESRSVIRLVGRAASRETKELQLRFNKQSKTDVWRRMAWGGIPHVNAKGNSCRGLPGPDVWAGILLPLFAVAGEDDNITAPEELSVIGKALRKGACLESNVSARDRASVPGATTTTGLTVPEKDIESDSSTDRRRVETWSSSTTAMQGGKFSKTENRVCSIYGNSSPAVFKSTILPSPATHALLYDHSTFRTLSGLIQTFLSEQIDSRLSLAWQLQHLKEANKWDVKNLAKWQAVRPVSGPIAGVFRALKTLREIDELHTPAKFVSDWREKIRAVIDISHESPVYNPQTLDEGGIMYRKFPTVSKTPPTQEEVRGFIALVEQLRSEGRNDDARLIGVHCHYGFNRTGFFICSFLIEKKGYGVQEAIDEFQVQRPPGIRHDHFLDELFVRYCVGLNRVLPM